MRQACLHAHAGTCAHDRHLGTVLPRDRPGRATRAAAGPPCRPVPFAPPTSPRRAAGGEHWGWAARLCRRPRGGGLNLPRTWAAKCRAGQPGVAAVSVDGDGRTVAGDQAAARPMPTGPGWRDGEGVGGATYRPGREGGTEREKHMLWTDDTSTSVCPAACTTLDRTTRSKSFSDPPYPGRLSPPGGRRGPPAGAVRQDRPPCTLRQSGAGGVGQQSMVKRKEVAVSFHYGQVVPLSPSFLLSCFPGATAFWRTQTQKITDKAEQPTRPSTTAPRDERPTHAHRPTLRSGIARLAGVVTLIAATMAS